MSIKDQIIADNTIFLNSDDFAELITYNDVKISAVIEIGDSSIEGNTFDHRGRSSVGTIEVSIIDIPVPVAGDQVVINSVDWRVARIIESDSAMHYLQITSGESVL